MNLFLFSVNKKIVTDKHERKFVNNNLAKILFFKKGRTFFSAGPRNLITSSGEIILLEKDEGYSLKKTTDEDVLYYEVNVPGQ